MIRIPWIDFLRRLRGGYRPIWIDYRPAPRPRWGYRGEPHPALQRLFAAGKSSYAERLALVLNDQERLRAIPARGEPRSGEPFWINGYLPGLDAAVLYAFVAGRAPRRYVEIGSGHSTRFAARAIRDHGLATEIVCFDPAPRAPVEGLAHRVDRRPLEEVPPEEFSALVWPGDIVFFDGSHRAFMNSDVTVFFLDVLPRLPGGVLVQIHDICLPFDYPPGWEKRWYSEQYLLAAYLLGGASGARIVMPNAFVGSDPDLAAIIGPLWSVPPLEGVERGGSSFWLETGIREGGIPT